MVVRFILYSVLGLLTLPSHAADWQGRARIQQSQPPVVSALPPGKHLQTAFQHRLLASEQWQWQPDWRVALELISAVEPHQQQQPLSLEHNVFDVHQLQLQPRWQSGQLSIGRQVWAVGEQRLLGKREGTNVRRRFDGVQLQQQLRAFSTLSGLADLQLQLYQGYQVNSRTGVLDDDTNWDLLIRGLSLQQQHGLLHLMQLRQHKAGLLEQRQSLELEHRLELHQKNGSALGQQQLFWQVIYQWGQQDTLSAQQQIEAWFGQFRLQQRWPQFTLAFTGSYASGGSPDPTQPAAGRSSRFVAALAKAPYYSEAGLFATTNLKHVGAQLSWQNPTDWRWRLDVKRLFRVDRGDGIFTQGKQPLLVPHHWQSSPVADTFSLVASYPLTAALEFELVSSLIQPRSGLALPRSSFFELVLHYRL